MKEEEFVNLFVSMGFTRNVATVLVFLANTGETTPRPIEHATGMPQYDVSLTMKYLTALGWIEIHRNASVKRGRPPKVCKLVMPLAKILDIIEQEKKNEAKNQLALFEKMKDFIR